MGDQIVRKEGLKLLPGTDYIKTIVNGLKQWVKTLFAAARPDWNQNDPNAPNYIKNRPGGYDIPESSSVLLDETISKERFVSDNDVAWVAEIAIDGLDCDLLYGTVNGVSVEGWLDDDGAVRLWKTPQLDTLIAGVEFDYDRYVFVLLNEPTTDCEVHLTQYTASYPVTIPKEYIDQDLLDMADEALALARNAPSSYDPVFSGDFSQNRKSGSKVGNFSHAEGLDTTASSRASHAEGEDTTASGYWAHAEGTGSSAEGHVSHAEGQSTTASGRVSHAEGWGADARGDYSHAEGYYTTASQDSSHAEGKNSYAYGKASHAEGQDTSADGDCSHAEGKNTSADGTYSHAEGCNTTASGLGSHAEGQATAASGSESHAEGGGTVAIGSCQHVQGKYNIEQGRVNNPLVSDYAHIVGNGTSDTNRSNAHTLDWSGNAWFSGDVYVGSTSGKDKDAGSKKLATEEYVDGRIQEDAVIINSSTPNSTKKFKIAVDDSGVISATEVVE